MSGWNLVVGVFWSSYNIDSSFYFSLEDTEEGVLKVIHSFVYILPINLLLLIEWFKLGFTTENIKENVSFWNCPSILHSFCCLA